MTATNKALTENAVDAHLRNQNRPEEADHLPLKDEKGAPINADMDKDED